MAVPYTFGTATAAIPLSQLDTNFATAITIGNTAVQLGNTVTTLNNMTLANVTISSGNVTITNVAVTTANVTTANIATSIITSGETLSFGTANGVAYLNTSKQVTTGSALTFDGTGLAIGNASPLTSGKLSILADLSAVNGLVIRDSATTYGNTDDYILLQNSTGGTAGGLTHPATTSLGVWGNTDIRFLVSSSATESMRLDSSGNLGLGVTPSAWQSGIKAITVSGANIYSGQSGAETGLTTNAYYNAGWSRISTGYATLYQQYNGGHFWFNAGSGTGAISFTQAMTLDSSGNLLVGATAAISGNSERLGVTASGASQPAILAKNVSGANDYTIPVWNATTTGDAKFIGFFTEASATLRGSITYNRGGGLVAYNITSDYRLKENIVDLTNAIKTVLQLKPRQFDWIETKITTTGFIAHELAEVCPHAVTGEKDGTRIEQYEISPAVPATFDKDGNELTPAVEAVMGEREVPEYQGIDTSFLVATLTAAIQEQQSIIQSLTDRISALEQK
jgi:hypothetical protein